MSGLHVDVAGPGDGASVLLLHGGNVGGWMWGPVRSQLDSLHTLVPDLPGFGQSLDLGWSGIDDAADHLASTIREHAHAGRAHVVGISLGAAVALALVVRHPGLVRSVIVSGTPIRGLGPVMRVLTRVQLRLWKSVAYWSTLGRWYHLPPAVLETFIEKGIGLDPDAAPEVVRQVNAGIRDLVAQLDGCTVPTLGLAGSRESVVVTHALADLARAEHAVLRLAPGKHHVWNLQAPALFADAVRDWVEHGRPHPDLAPVPRSVARHARRIARRTRAAAERSTP